MRSAKVLATFLALTFTLACFKTSNDQSRLQQLGVTVNDNDLSPGWTATVVDVSEPASVRVQTTNILGQTLPEENRMPPANQKWLLLGIELRPPQKGVAISDRQIKLIDQAGNAHTIVGIDTMRENKVPSFVYFKESNGSYVITDENLRDDIAVYAFSKNIYTGEYSIAFHKQEARRAFLLFEVPATEKTFRFRI